MTMMIMMIMTMMIMVMMITISDFGWMNGNPRLHTIARNSIISGKEFFSSITSVEE